MQVTEDTVLVPIPISLLSSIPILGFFPPSFADHLDLLTFYKIHFKACNTVHIPDILKGQTEAFQLP